MKFKSEKIRQIAELTLKLESEAIGALRKRIGKDFVKSVEKIISSGGRVVVTGIGKSAVIAQKMVATFNSTGTPSLFMHAADAIHGDLGMITPDDVVICLSKSGESPEIKVLVPLIKNGGNFLVSITGNMNSFLAKNSDLVLDTTVAKEACPHNLAPTTSTTAQLAMGDALAVCLLECRGFSEKDFARFHPGGALGKKLYLRVDALFSKHESPAVHENDLLGKVILEMTKKRLGATAVLNSKKELSGMITDGDLRRAMEKHKNFSSLKAADVMNASPKKISKGSLAVDALSLMREHKITQAIVVDKKKYLGIVHLHDLLREGLI